MIARLFEPGHRGFYVDIGAADPEFLSVTNHFYQNGWRGINVEPVPRFQERLRRERPEDVNLAVAVSTLSGPATFYELGENSTTVGTVAEMLVSRGDTAIEREVETLRLDEICRLYTGGRTIDFMKIDVEGAELDVLQSGDWEQFRPTLLVIEAVEVNGSGECWREWEPFVLSKNYRKVWFDGLNNFYLAEEKAELESKFRTPPNVFDGFETAECAATRARLQASEDTNAVRLELVERLNLQLAAANADRAARDGIIADFQERLRASEEANAVRLKLIDDLNLQLAAANDDRRARDEIIRDLETHLRASEGENATRLELINELHSQLAAANEDRVARGVVIAQFQAALEASEKENARRQERVETLSARVASYDEARPAGEASAT